MYIIGHRGAAGLALENTLESFKAALEVGVDAVELDVRKTADDILVVFHDANLKRLADQDRNIDTLTYQTLKGITLSDGKSTIPKLSEVFDLLGSLPLLIELKEDDCVEPLLQILNQYPKANVTILSFMLAELSTLRDSHPDVKIYANEQTKPIEVIQHARARKFNGVGLNYWLLNPLTYLMIRRAKLDLFVFTVNRPFLGKVIGKLYPHVAICTDHPEYFISKTTGSK